MPLNVSAPNLNVLFLVADNLRPALRVYGDKVAISPNIDEFARSGATIFSRAYCQVAWDRTWNFHGDFRSNANNSWVSMPGYFLRNGFHTLSVGKVFHGPHLDYPQSWSAPPLYPKKCNCMNDTACTTNGSSLTMACQLGNSAFDVDRNTTDQALAWLETMGGRRFFLAVGYQSTRLPWAVPASVAARYPPLNSSYPPIALHQRSGVPRRNESGAQQLELEWFRPTEVDAYTDIRNITHQHPMPEDTQRRVKHAYYAAMTHIDDQVGRMLRSLARLGLDSSTIVVFTADHGQNLGEHNMWAMMNLLEPALRVPMLIRTPDGRGGTYPYPASLVDLYPTLAHLAGLPPALEAYDDLDGRVLDLDHAHVHARTDADGGSSAATAEAKLGDFIALSQITRCRNCTKAYTGADHPSECTWDSAADAEHWFVPCCLTPRTDFDWMGMSMRTLHWRYTMWCRWDGSALRADWTQCEVPELYDHRNDSTSILFDPDHEENVNVAGEAQFGAIEEQLKTQLKAAFSIQRGAERALNAN